MTEVGPSFPGSPRQDRLVDLGLACGAVAVIAVAITADTSGGTRPVSGFTYLFAVAMGAPLLWRRHYPVGVLLVTCLTICAYYIAHYPPIGLALPLGAALYVAANAGRARWAIGVALGLVSLSVFFRIQRGEDLRYLLLYDTVLTLAVMAVAVALGDSQRSKTMWRRELEQNARQATWQRDQEARERVAHERARIARDLHDSMGHSITVIALHAEVALESVPDLDPTTREALDRMRRASRDALTELRSVVSVLRTPEPDNPEPTLADLGALIQHLGEGGLAVSLRTDGDVGGVPSFVGATGFRIVQESLTNAARHSQGSRAAVHVAVLPRRVEITVADDGPGGRDHPASSGGHGIRGMVERAEAIGGVVRADARPGGGFAVTAVLPLARP